MRANREDDVRSHASERLGASFIELDALNRGPDWSEATSEELRAKATPIVATDSWVIDGAYPRQAGRPRPRRADVVVWLDLPTRVWLPRLLRHTLERIFRREDLWAGNRETLRNVFLSRNSLLMFTLRNYRRRRLLYPEQLGHFNLVRLRTTAEVERFLSSVSERPTAK